MTLKGFCQQAHVRRQPASGEVAHAVPHGIGAGQDYNVGGQRNRDLSVGSRKPHAFGGETVESGGANPGIAIATEVVGTHRVEGDEQYGWAMILRELCRAVLARGTCGGKNREGRNQHKNRQGRPERHSVFSLPDANRSLPAISWLSRGGVNALKSALSNLLAARHGRGWPTYALVEGWPGMRDAV